MQAATQGVFVMPGSIASGTRCRKGYLSFHPSEANPSLPNKASLCDQASENIVSGDPNLLVNFNYPLNCFPLPL